MPVSLVALVLAASAPSAAGAPPKDAPPASIKALVQSCDAHKFELTVQTEVDGKPHGSKVKICGNEGQTDADWVRTLEDAQKKLAANTQMLKPVRDQIIAGLAAEISKIKGQAQTQPLAGTPSGARDFAPSLDNPAPQAGYSVLPPFPAPPAAAPAIAPQTGYSVLPPFPAPPAAATAIPPQAAASTPTLARPRIAFGCYTPGDLGDGLCSDFARDTTLIVRAGEDLPSGTVLRFLRDHQAKGDIPLVPLRKGKTVRLQLPSAVCSGVVVGLVEVQIIRTAGAGDAKGQVVGSEGPYNLRCS